MASQTLNLERPMVVFDLETTGLDIQKDRIVEIACVKLQMDGGRTTLTYRINPGIPIPEAASQVHGIYDHDVANAPGFVEVADELAQFLTGCDFSGFNLERFDLPLLKNEFERTGKAFPTEAVHIVDVHKVFILKEPRDLSAAYRFYCNKNLDNAHSAEADATATADILLAQVEHYDDLPSNVAQLHAFCHTPRPGWVDADGKLRWKDGEPVLSFGKHKNRSLKELASDERGYLQWIAGADFSSEFIGIIKDALDGKFPTQQGKPSPAS